MHKLHIQAPFCLARISIVTPAGTAIVCCVMLDDTSHADLASLPPWLHDEFVGKDRLSEVHVPSGIVAVLYQHSSYSGDKAVIVGESPRAPIPLPQTAASHRWTSPAHI